MVEHVPTEHNPADRPSREGEPFVDIHKSCFQVCANCSEEELRSKVFLKDSDVEHNILTTVFNGLQNPKTRAWFMQHYKWLIADNLDWFDKPIKVLTLKAALADYF